GWPSSVTRCRGSGSRSEVAASEVALGVPGAPMESASTCCTLRHMPSHIGPPHPRCPIREGPTCGRPAAPHVCGSDRPGACGRHDTAQQMYESLTETLGSLPPETKVFCGHEHTLGNLEFAQKVEPSNDHVRAKLSWAKKRDEDDMPTVPSTLCEELLYNPFLRVAEEPVRKFTGKAAPAEVLEALCKERASFQRARAAEPLQPQARALLALQWGLLGTPRQK
uniref:Hydroxyacylglutathione hydrolase like n=1 Tax=Ursus maritimus TaxID=29073 RepID=A0A452V6R2_URSMA